MESDNLAYATGIMPEPTPDPRNRETVQVQLDLDKPDEQRIVELRNRLSPQKQFKKLLIRALEITAALEDDDFDPLFLHYGGKINSYINELMDARFARIESHLEALREQIEAMNADRERVGQKRMEIPPAPADFVLTTETDDSVDPAKRFLKALGIKK